MSDARYHSITLEPDTTTDRPGVYELKFSTMPGMSTVIGELREGDLETVTRIVSRHLRQHNTRHVHYLTGQALHHNHEDGNKPHGYYEHPEDGNPQRLPGELYNGEPLASVPSGECPACHAVGSACQCGHEYV